MHAITHTQKAFNHDNQTHDHLIYDWVVKIVCLYTTDRQMGADKGRFCEFPSKMTVGGVCSDWRPPTAAFLPPGVTSDASYLASVIRSRANIG